ncbi:cathelicidin antimicrobial peptide isoform X2 [Leopardus geoffroyi]|uniref:cathelicidin antimicrobial peptide isoform X2 n=1 Tax=Leopardus geoffroyi TaxID=46844 RepID=UPI001E2614B9|nr:cathelicidin antimicrobial peptide isoform X2 [Leopardus geoffroyi]
MKLKQKEKHNVIKPFPPFTSACSPKSRRSSRGREEACTELTGHPFAINTLEYGAIKEEDHFARRPRKKDEDPNTPKPVSFKVKETVCPKTTQRPLEQCDFKDDGLVKQCEGTVILDQNRGYFDINCDAILQVRKLGQLGELIQRGGQKIGEKIQNIGQRIRDFFSNLRPRQEA